MTAHTPLLPKSPPCEIWMNKRSSVFLSDCMVTDEYRAYMWVVQRDEPARRMVVIGADLPEPQDLKTTCATKACRMACHATPCVSQF